MRQPQQGEHPQERGGDSTQQTQQIFAGVVFVTQDGLNVELSVAAADAWACPVLCRTLHSDPWPSLCPATPLPPPPSSPQHCCLHTRTHVSAAYIEARLAARLRSSSAAAGGRKQQQQQYPCPRWLLRRTELPKLPFEYVGVVLPPLMLLMSVAPAEPAFLLLFLLWGSLALKLWMRLAHGPGARQHVAHMLQHMATPRKRWGRQGGVGCWCLVRSGMMVALCVGGFQLEGWSWSLGAGFGL